METAGAGEPKQARPRRPKQSPYRSVLRLRNYRRLWIGMGVSSLGDWIGLFAMLSIVNRLSPRNTLAVAGLMVFRMLPAFVVGPVAGALLDRVDRRKAMVVCDLLRAAIIASIPFVRSLPVLFAISFALEALSLIWMPAKDALVPSLVPNRWLVTANSMALFTTYGVFPLGSLVFTGLVSVASLLGQGTSPEHLALWIDSVSFLASAFVVWGIKYPELPRAGERARLGAIVDDVVEGLRYLREARDVGRVIRGIGFALAGAAVVFSLGAPYVTQVLHGGARGFGAIVTASGAGVGVGVLALGFIGERIPKGVIFAWSLLAVGTGLLVVSALSGLLFATLVAVLIGAFGGAAYATGFALVQETVSERLMGRTMASLQVVIRVSLLASLVVFPALAKLLLAAGAVHSVADGIRLAIALGGLVTVAAGTLAARDVFKHRIGEP